MWNVGQERNRAEGQKLKLENMDPKNKVVVCFLGSAFLFPRCSFALFCHNFILCRTAASQETKSGSVTLGISLLG